MREEDYMEFEEIKITDIIPSNYNPRKISNTEYNKLSRSIDTFGVVDPIIINLRNNHIIGGHQRYDVLLDEHIADNKKYKTLQLIRLGDIGWVFPSNDLKIRSIEEEKALNIALNKIQGEWNNEKLEDLFNDLSIEGVDLTLTGFDKLEIKNLFKDVDVNNQIYDGIQNDLYGELLNESLEKESASNNNGSGGSSSSTGSLSPKLRVCPSCGYEYYE